MLSFLALAGTVAVAILFGAAILHLIPMLGPAGKRVAMACCRAPGLDLIVTYFTVAPLFVGPIVAGWRGFFAGVVGQVIGMLAWQFAHEFVHRDAVKGPRIVRLLNKNVGTLRNLTAVYSTGLVTPLFWCVRVAELFLYPVLVCTVRFPRYNQGEWVNVSRQKFSGLVGHDLIWCLYCDWMTGVWSLGTEMLRNVESFWCPIRFSSEKKCENCTTDFPDVNGGWVPANATMADVVGKVEQMYPKGDPLPRTWFGHPARLTVKGEPIETASIK